MKPIKVVVHGAFGKMGREVVTTVCRERELELAGVVSLSARPGSYDLPDGAGAVPISNSLDDVVGGADVVVDFTNAEGAMQAMRSASANGVGSVIGSTGLSDADLAEAESLSRERQVGIVVAPNFALGAVLMVHVAKVLAPFFDYADLTEMHHEAKKDAPSGTALAIAKAAADARDSVFLAPETEKEVLDGVRGGLYEGVSIHSARMQGRMAHHRLVFGTLGQTLTVLHDSISRESFMPGVVMAIRQVVEGPGLIVGLENLLDL